jgi:metal-sulfur cluster biosynthetic enzyme
MSATDLDDPNKVRKMSTAEIDKKNKTELKRALLAMLKVPDETEVTDILKQILNEMNLMREERKEFMEELSALRKENEVLREQLKQQGNILKHHQQFMEKIDAKERGCNLIMVGIIEGADQSEVTDTVKVRETITTAGAPPNTEIKTIRRLGVKEANKNRPIMVELTSLEERNKIVEMARNSTAEALRNIRLKKDAHPAVRAEWRRLFAVKEKEEKKSENANCTITIDMRKRQVLRDGQCIDAWCQQLF